MNNKKLSLFLQTGWLHRVLIALISACSLAGCGFVRVLLLEPFDEVELKPQPFDMSSHDAPGELTRTTLARSYEDLETIKKQGNNTEFRKAIDRLEVFQRALSELIQNKNYGLLANVSTPKAFSGTVTERELAKFRTTPEQNLVLPTASLTAALPKPGFQRAISSRYTASATDLKLRVLRYPFATASETYFSQTNGPQSAAPDCRATGTCATAKQFLTNINVQPSETAETDDANLQISLQNIFVRSLQTYQKAKNEKETETVYNNYQAAVQCAHAEMTQNGTTSEVTWPRLASLALNLAGKGDTYRYTMTANTLLTNNDTLLTVPTERIEVVVRPEIKIERDAKRVMRVKAFQFTFDGAEGGERFEYHQYLIPFFSRFWNSVQGTQDVKQYFASSVPHGRTLILENTSQRTEYGNAPLPSSEQVAWLAESWQKSGHTSASMPLDDWTQPMPYRVFNRDGDKTHLGNEPDFNKGGALNIDVASGIDKFLLALPSENIWSAAAFKDEGLTYQVKEFFEGLAAQCDQVMTAN